ncbi:AAA family ATPase [Petrimonas sp.]|uniref:AAA family ATPase n=1 Tax=Petrimonas sp. TaxID=2023866 RepID=UPI003F517B6E
MITKEDILNKTNNGYEIFRHYIPIEFKPGKNFKNPFYDDKRPSCNVYFDRRMSQFRIKDFGNEDFSGDCFSFVAAIKGMDVRNDFGQILQLINDELHLGLNDNQQDVSLMITQKTKKLKSISAESNRKKTDKLFTTIEKPFTDKELAFWSEYGVLSEMLNRFKVKSLQSYSSVNADRKNFTIESSLHEPVFGYFGKNHIKLYRPFSTLRFLYGGTLPDNYCFGLEQLPNRGSMLFITGGEKDVMSLSVRGFNAICFNSESSAIPSNLIERLRHRFRHIILLYDTDTTGLEMSAKREEELSRYEVKRMVLPLSGEKSEKDISDYFKAGNTKNDFNRLLMQLLASIYDETMLLMQSCEVDLNNPPPNMNNIITINQVPVGTAGNLLCLTGGEGTGKSNFTGAIIAGTLATDAPVDTLGLNVEANNDGKVVLLYDTEQSEIQLHKNVRRILNRAGQREKPNWLKAFYLTAMSRKERLISIRNSIDYYFHRFGGIHLIVIDGIADLIRSANDEAESIAIVDELYRLADIYKTCILCVLHFVPNGIKLRGHIGSELQRKAAAILSVEIDDNPRLSVVKTLKVRDGSPLDVPIIQFKWDDEKGMHVYGGVKSKEDKEKRKIDELTAVAKDIFRSKRFLTYNELCAKIVGHMETSERTAKSYIKYMREQQIIAKDTDTGSLHLALIP